MNVVSFCSGVVLVQAGKKGLKTSGCIFDVILTEYGRDNRQHIGPGIDQFFTVHPGNPANSDNGYGETLSGLRQQIDSRVHRVWFDTGWKKTSEGNIVCTVSFGINRPIQVVIAGYPDNGIGSDLPACSFWVGILSAQMDTVGPDFAGQVDVIVNNKGYIVFSAQCLQ